MPLLVFSAIFLLSSTSVHLYSLEHLPHRVQNVSKACLIPSIFLFFYSLSMQSHGEPLPGAWYLYLPLIFYLAGDILLEFQSRKCFIIGAISFMIGHVCYSLVFLSYGFHLSSFIFCVIAWLVAYIALAFFLTKNGNVEAPLYMLYIFFVLIMGVSIGASYLSNNALARSIGIIGSFVFAISDFMIVVQRIEHHKRYEVAIMSTYILANMMIQLSLYLA